MELTKESRQKSREDKFSYEYSAGQSRTEIRKPGRESIQNIQVCNSVPVSYLCRQIQVVTILYVKNENLYETDGGTDRRP